MELKRTRKSFYLLVGSLLFMVLTMGAWWLFLVFKLANKLQVLNIPLLEGNLISMIKWEGATFVVLLLCLTVTLVYIYMQDFKKSSSLQAFFASLTHELKTPVASMKLQAQVLESHIEDLSIKSDQEKLLKYTGRIKDDALRLEDQLDNHLQLSRVERDAPLNLRTIDFSNFLKAQSNRYSNLLNINLNLKKDIKILADDFALQIIIRNLIENAIHHAEEKPAVLNITQDEKTPFTFNFRSNGRKFTGDERQLGRIFYKHNSPKGTGIGLYLIRNLMKQMKGQFDIHNHDRLEFELTFKDAQENPNE